MSEDFRSSKVTKTAGGKRPESLVKEPQGSAKSGRKQPGTPDSLGFLPCDCLFQINFLVRVAVCKPEGETGRTSTDSIPGLFKQRSKGTLPASSRQMRDFEKAGVLFVCLGFFSLLFFLFSMTSFFQGLFSLM